MIWVVNANSTICRIYNYSKKPSQLVLLKELLHPESRIKASVDLTSDKPGHYQTQHSSHGSYGAHTDPHAVEIDKFSRQIAVELEHGRTQGLYKQLILISPAHMNGNLGLHLNKHVKELVTHHLHKDLLNINENDLLDFIHSNTRYPEK